MLGRIATRDLRIREHDVRLITKVPTYNKNCYHSRRKIPSTTRYRAEANPLEKLNPPIKTANSKQPTEHTHHLSVIFPTTAHPSSPAPNSLRLFPKDAYFGAKGSPTCQAKRENCLMYVTSGSSTSTNGFPV